MFNGIQCRLKPQPVLYSTTFNLANGAVSEECFIYRYTCDHALRTWCQSGFWAPKEKPKMGKFSHSWQTRDIRQRSSGTQRGSGKVHRASLVVPSTTDNSANSSCHLFISPHAFQERMPITVSPNFTFPLGNQSSSCHFSRRREAACSSDDLHLLALNSQLMNGPAFNPSFRTFNILDCLSDAP